MSWPWVKKIVILKCCLILFYATTKNRFMIGLWHGTKYGFYVTTSSDQLSGCTEKLQSTSRSQMCLNPCETIASEKYTQQSNEMYWKQQHLEPILVNRKSSNLLCNDTQKHITQQSFQMLNELDYKVLFHLPYSSDFLPTDEHFFKHLDNFLQGKCFHKQQDS